MVRAGASVHHARSVAAMFATLARGVPREGTHREESATPTTLTVWTKSELLPLVEAPGLLWETDGASAILNRAQRAISVLAPGRLLRGFNAARARADDFPFYVRGDSTVRRNQFVRPCQDTFAEHWVGEGI